MLLGFGAWGLKFRFLFSGFSRGSYVVLSRGLEYKYISMPPKNDLRTSCRVNSVREDVVLVKVYIQVWFLLYGLHSTIFGASDLGMP